MVTDMHRNKILKLMVLSVCVVLLFGLVACKSNTTDKDDNSSISQQGGLSSGDNTEAPNNESLGTTSGIELEEDVFDDDNIVENTSSNDSTSNKPADKDNQSTDKGEDNTSSDKAESDTSSDDISDTESGDVSSDETPTESDDGTVKLPVDWF